MTPLSIASTKVKVILVLAIVIVASVVFVTYQFIKEKINEIDNNGHQQVILDNKTVEIGDNVGRLRDPIMFMDSSDNTYVFEEYISFDNE